VMIDAPAMIDDAQLKELNIKLNLAWYISLDFCWLLFLA
jgi:hypothetical protein